MQTPYIISLIVNIGLIMLVLSLVYPRLIARYRRKKKQGEIQEYNRIKRYVNEYLDSLRTDDN
jgi:ArsR family metal-binding transcriptional regulator